MENLLKNANTTIECFLTSEEKVSLNESLSNDLIGLLKKASKIDAPKVIPAIIVCYAINTICICYLVLFKDKKYAFKVNVAEAIMNFTLINTIGHTKGILLESYIEIAKYNALSSYIKLIHNFFESTSLECALEFINNVQIIFETDDIDDVYTRLHNILEQASKLVTITRIPVSIVTTVQ